MCEWMLNVKTFPLCRIVTHDWWRSELVFSADSSAKIKLGLIQYFSVKINEIFFVMHVRPYTLQYMIYIGCMDLHRVFSYITENKIGKLSSFIISLLSNCGLMKNKKQEQE